MINSKMKNKKSQKDTKKDVAPATAMDFLIIKDKTNGKELLRKRG